MADNFILTTCKQHPECTLRAVFVSDLDPRFDPVSDQKPVSAYLASIAERDFGPSFCVALEHLEGKLSIEVPV